MSTPFSTLRMQLAATLLLGGAADPTEGAGVAAPIGSQYWRDGVAGVYNKTGEADTEWEQALLAGVYFNVLDYRAAGDGVTDDSAAVQAAIDAADVAGGTVFFPPGAYGVSGLVITGTGVRLLGSGWGGARLVHLADANGADVSMITVQGGATATEFEGLTFDQSGLTNPTASCRLIDVEDASIVKVLTCRFMGGVAGAGSYLYAGGAEASNLLQIANCYATRDAGGPIVELAGNVSRVWLLDSDVIHTTGSAIVCVDAAGNGIDNVQIAGNYIEAGAGHAIEMSSTATAENIQIVSNGIRGFVSVADASAAQFRHNEIYLEIEGDAPVLSFADCTYLQVQKNLVARLDAADAGRLITLDAVTRSLVQGNTWLQETEAGLLEGVDLVTVQLSGNASSVVDAGSDAHDAYLIRATSSVDNLQILNERISASSGSWNRALRFLRDGANFGHLQINGNLIRDCATGVMFDDATAGSTAFAGMVMVAGGIVDATTAALSMPSGMFVRIGGNASTFGANVFVGVGSPLNVLVARVGSICHRLDGGAGTTLYVKESGTNATGWVAK